MKHICTLSLLFVGLIPNSQVQTAAQAAAPPVPEAILSAKTAFISNDMAASADLSGGPTRGYNQFYAGVKATGRYELVDDPSKADLILQIQAVPSDSIRAGLEGIRLRLYDRKTHFILWTLVRPVGACALKKGCDKNFDIAIDGLIHDLMALNRQSPPDNNH